MKKLLVGIVIISILMAGGRALADPATDGSRTVLSPDFALTETINNIKVPYSVLLDSQMNNQGYAVVTVHSVKRAGQDLYRLHIKSGTGGDRSRENIYLLYDKNWQFIGDEKTLAPLPVNPEPIIEVPAVPVPEPQENETPAEEPEDEEGELDEEELEELEMPQDPIAGRAERRD